MKLTPAQLEHVAARFKVLAEPLRLQILQQMQGGPQSVNELATAAGASQPNVSKHLKILQDEGLVTRRKQGTNVYYSIEDPSVFELCDVVCGSLRAGFADKHAVFA